MIELEVNGQRQVVDLHTTGELRALVQRELPGGHVIRRIDVNGGEVDEGRLAELDIGRLHTVAVKSCTAAEIARESLSETAEWIGRICGVLESIASDYRLGHEKQGTTRLVDVVDALQVLVPLLAGLRANLQLEPAQLARFEDTWPVAERDLCGCIEGLFAELQDRDPVMLADRTGHSLPRTLKQFRELLVEL